LSQSIIRLDAALMALTNDIIAHYCYGENYNCLGQDDFQVSFKDTLMTAVATGAFVRHFPWVSSIMSATPIWVVRLMSKNFAALLDWEQIIKQQVRSLMQRRKSGKEIMERSIFQALLNSDLPEEEKSYTRLLDEGKSLMGAGSETTSWALTLSIFYLLENKDIMQKLRKELRDMPREGPLLRNLERMPYLVSYHLRRERRLKC
jgi:cytochrome P450